MRTFEVICTGHYSIEADTREEAIEKVKKKLPQELKMVSFDTRRLE